ncbi:MAG: hypothetical protein JWP44_2579 [Mucilaginibacter sp.]|nr:hypothetical protein [Mucilaginibacter sp.]
MQNQTAKLGRIGGIFKGRFSTDESKQLTTRHYKERSNLYVLQINKIGFLGEPKAGISYNDYIPLR